MILKQELIQLHVSARDAQDALTQAAAPFIEKGYAKESFPEALITREASFPTALPAQGVDICIPHADPSHILETAVGVVVLGEAVEFKMMGDPETLLHPRIMFVLGLKEAHGQVEMLQKLIEVIQDEQLLQDILNASEPQVIYDLLAEKLG